MDAIITLLHDEGLLAVPKEFHGFTLHEAIRTMPGKRYWRGDILHFQLSEENLEHFRKNFPKARWDDKAGILKEISELRAKKKPVIKSNIQYQFKTKPFNHQLIAFERSRNETAFALFMEMGTGKTKVAIDNAAWLYINGQIDCVFIIAPNNVHKQWIDEQLPEHLPSHIDNIIHVWKRGKPTSAIITPTTKLRWLAMNVEAIITEKGAALATQFLASGRTLFIVDESHKIKSYKAKRTKQIVRLGQLATHRRILTGSPLAKGVEDYFSQFLFLSPSIIGHRSYFTFRNRYCRMGGYMAKIIVGYQNMDELHSLIAPYTYQIEAKDCLDIPFGTYTKRYCDLTPDQKYHYAAVKRELFTILDNGDVIETPLAIQKLVRLQQITCGFLPHEDGTFQILDNNRPLVVDDILEECSGEQAIIWCRYQQDVSLLCARYGKDAIRYDGTISKKEEAIAKADYISGKRRLFIATPAKGGTGTDGLQGHSRIVVFYSNSYNSLDRWQAEKRTERLGTRERQLFIDVIAHGTIDLPVQANLRKKKDIAKMSMNEIRSMIEGGKP